MFPRLAAPVALLGLCAALASACSDVGPENDGLLQDIANHRAMWESKRPPAYVYELKRWCDCPDEARGPVSVRVQGVTVVGRVYTPTGAPLTAGLESAFPSVDGLFDLLEAAARKNPWSVNINWDPEAGFPRDLYVDFKSNVIHDEVSYQVVVPPTPAPGS